MSADRASETFLSRWSRRKLAAARPAEAAPPEAAPASAPAVPVPAPASPASAAAAAPASELPPVESLTFDSDFTGFLKPGVEPTVQRAALRKLLRDPRFNAMDGLDVYIDDYAKPSPLDPAVARTLAHARALFAPPRTRVNAQGFVEDVPEESVEQAPAESAGAIAATDAPRLAAQQPDPGETPSADTYSPGAPAVAAIPGAQSTKA